MLAQVDSSILAEARDHLAGGRIEGIDEIHHSNKEPSFPAFAPISNPAIGLAPLEHGVEGPLELPRRCVESNRLQCGSECIENAVHNNRRCLNPSRLAGIELPRHLEFLDVGAVDLFQAGVM